MTKISCLLTIALAGCMTEGSSTSSSSHDVTTPSSPEEQIYDDTVAPILTNSCDTCHGANAQTFPDTVTLDYQTITSDPSLNGNFSTSASILTKGYHEGPAFTADEEQAVEVWLLAESIARGAN